MNATRLRTCRDCRAEFAGEDWQRLCWRCWRERRDAKRDDAAYERGYSDGFRAGSEVTKTLDADLLKRTIALTHPDRHADRFAEANEVTARLLNLRGLAA
jgi:hypothetical protein